MVPPSEGLGRHRHPVAAEGLHLDQPNEVLWSRGNLDEALPGVVTPLSWSLWSRAFEWSSALIYRDRLGVITAEEAEQLGTTVETCTAALSYGRAVANVDQLRMVMDRMPGGDPDAFELQMLGSVREDAASEPTRARYPSVLRHLPPAVVLVGRRVRAHRRDTHAWWLEVTGSRAPTDLAGARALFVEAVHRFVSVTTDHSTALFLGQAAYQQLTDLAADAGLAGHELALATTGDAEEAVMVRDVWAAAAGELDLHELLARHGFHGPGEGELSGRSWRDDPAPLLALIDTYRQRGAPSGGGEAAASRRAAAQAELRTSLGPAGRARLRLTLLATDRLLPLRETGKAAFLEALDAARLAARTAGRALADRGVLDDAEDVFLCTWEELVDPATIDRGAVDERRRLLEHLRTLEVPDTFVGVPEPVLVEERRATGRLTGIGASPGVVEGTARVLTDPGEVERLRPGDVLVTTVTDPGWAPVFELASAVVVDTGTALSHAAIVARELGIPGVVSAPGASRAIPDGARVRVDGTSGRVELVHRLVHRFDEPIVGGAAAARSLLGGKGAHLAEMAGELGLPVPPGFTLTTEAFHQHAAHGWTDTLDEALAEALVGLEAATGRRLGGAERPLLVSVRSGAPASMPGMMDTVLDVGMDDDVERALAEESGDAAFAADCRRRFVEMYRHTVGEDPPAEPHAQVRGAVAAVFRSWDGERARAYRAVEGIDDALGTAATVQAMVFGNLDERSATGVVFSRDPATGAPELYGDVLFRAQGDDVVSGTADSEPISALQARLPEVADQLRAATERLERHLGDLADVEFTVERGALWILQVRTGKRSPVAELRMAVDMAEDPDFPLTRAEAVARATTVLDDPPRQTASQHHEDALGRGLPASPGVAVGRCALDPRRAVAMATAGPVVLVRPSTSPDDVAGMAEAVGIITKTGGLTSHAAVVARGWGIPSVVSLGALDFADDGRSVVLGDRRIVEGDLLTIDGSTGEVFGGALETTATALAEVAVLRRWRDELGGAPGRSTRATARPYETTAEPPGEATLDDVLVALLVVGTAVADRVAPTAGATPAATAALLDEACAGALAECTGASWRLAPSGAAQAEQALARAADTHGAMAFAASLDAFAPLDREVKERVTAWQLAEAEADRAELLAGFDPLVASIDHLLATVGGTRPLRGHGRRLAGALGAARHGDDRFVAAPTVDSFHNVWFELHELLIRLAGRTRADEVAAGRTD